MRWKSKRRLLAEMLQQQAAFQNALLDKLDRLYTLLQLQDDNTRLPEVPYQGVSEDTAPILFSAEVFGQETNALFAESSSPNDLEQLLKVKENWTLNHTQGHLRFPLSEMDEGRLLEADLGEYSDGPHGLIVSPIMRERSEWLERLIILLAARYSSDELNFIIITDDDVHYTHRLERLPHVVNIAKSSELPWILMQLRETVENRSRMLANAECSDCNKYSHDQLDKGKKPMPHLMICVNLDDQLPELEKHWSSLIQIVRVARSLGVYMVTGAAAESITDELSCNSRFLICTHTTDPGRYVELFQIQESPSPLAESQIFYFVKNQWIPFRLVPLNKYKLEMVERALFRAVHSELDPF